MKSPRDGSVFYHPNMLEEFLPQSKHIIYILTWEPNSSANWIRNRFDSRRGRGEVVKRRSVRSLGKTFVTLVCTFGRRRSFGYLSAIVEVAGGRVKIGRADSAVIWGIFCV